MHVQHVFIATWTHGTWNCGRLSLRSLRVSTREKKKMCVQQVYYGVTRLSIARMIQVAAHTHTYIHVRARAHTVQRDSTFMLNEMEIQIAYVVKYNRYKRDVCRIFRWKIYPPEWSWLHASSSWSHMYHAQFVAPIFFLIGNALQCIFPSSDFRALNLKWNLKFNLQMHSRRNLHEPRY